MIRKTIRDSINLPYPQKCNDNLDRFVGPDRATHAPRSRHAGVERSLSSRATPCAGPRGCQAVACGAYGTHHVVR